MSTAKKKPTSSNANYYMVLALVSLLAVGATVLIGKSLVTSIMHESKVLAAKNEAVKALDKDLTAAPQLVSSYKSLSPANLAILNDALPNTSDFPSLITMLENIASQSGVTLSAVQPDAGTTAPAVDPTATTDATATTTGASASETTGAKPVEPKDYEFTMGVKGSFASIMKFYSNLELSARPVRITGLHVAGSNSSLTATLNLTTYYQDKAVLPFSTKVIK